MRFSPISFFLAIWGTSPSVTVQATSEVVQAQVPPRTSYEEAICKQTIFQHSFASSYGVPYVGFYSSPEGCDFTTTIFNLSVTSQGRQYDRLALLFLGDIEVWRTSTAMPSQEGIYWSYQKDMTAFDTLLRKEQKVIFDLSNVFTDLYTGAFNVTLEALYFNDEYISGLSPPNQIFPISALASSKNISSVMSLPDGNATVSIQLPRNVKTATVSLQASGNGAEEFWYTNVPSEYVNTFPDNPGWLFGYSPFREVQLLIDGNLAGVSWPFPLLFTGGVDPGLWRPIVGIDAYDMPTFDIDVTPWLPLLCDGKPHEFGLKVVAFDSTVEGNVGPIGENWWVTGTVFVWLDAHGKQTTGSSIANHTPDPVFDFHPQVTTTTPNNITSNSSFYFDLSARRTISIISTICTSSGSKVATWSQSLSFTNIQNMTDSAFNQSLSMLTTGTHTDSFSGVKSSYAYPLNLYSSYIIAPSSKVTLSSVLALIDRSLITKGINLLSHLTGLKIGSESLSTRQSARSKYYWNATIVEGTTDDTGVLEQWFSYAGKSAMKKNGVGEFSRHLKEVDDRIVFDDEAWRTMSVPATQPLPYVDGEPVV
ncbi:peptide N-acetyl-beta-D-glucosaminyl asparaginase amidase A-domain-containing protein [Leptodontidium sp. 2 PMI_412]|nr:peptide N-acetyl-beta-D-glucosaminyl asparaginase amidase A-domain-containing protein [Leptodontidium sp. 2 PMI_412]